MKKTNYYESPVIQTIETKLEGKICHGGSGDACAECVDDTCGTDCSPKTPPLPW